MYNARADGIIEELFKPCVWLSSYCHCRFDLVKFPYSASIAVCIVLCYLVEATFSLCLMESNPES